MACHAIVTRLDPEKGEKILVGVHFYKLEMAHRIALAQGLSQKQKLPPQALESEDTFTSLKVVGQVFMMSLLLSLWSWLMLSLIELGYHGYMQLMARWF